MIDAGVVACNNLLVPSVVPRVYSAGTKGTPSCSSTPIRTIVSIDLNSKNSRGRTVKHCHPHIAA